MSESADTRPNFLKAQLDLQARILYSTLPDHLKPTALAYALHMNNHSRQTRPSVGRIAQLIGKDRRTVGRNLTELEALKVFIPHRARSGGQGEAGITPYSINIDELQPNASQYCDTDVAVLDSAGDLPFNEYCDTDVAVLDPPVQSTATPVTSTATSGEKYCDMGVAGTVQEELCTELRTLVPPDQVVPNSEQQREERAATPDVAITGHGWHPWASEGELDAYLATAAMPGPFASPKQARWFGYRIFGAHPDEPATTLANRLYDALLAKQINTSHEQCLAAICDVLTDRAQRDRTYDRKTDLDRRAGRR